MLLRKVIRPVINHKDPRLVKENIVEVEETITANSVPLTNDRPTTESILPKEEPVPRPGSPIGKKQKKNKKLTSNLNQGSDNEEDSIRQ